jgi:acyl-coenzyme A synthetase/AMP-(fatty) acid ligase
VSESTTLAALLAEHPFAPDEPLLFGPDGELTAAAARAAVDALAERLRAAGAGPGLAVAVQRPNDTSAIVAMFAVWRAGAVFVPINPRSPVSERDAALDATGPVAVVVDDAVTIRDDARRYDPSAAFVLWTSGTTGRPKPIVHTHVAYLELLDRVLGPLRGRAADAAVAGSTRRPTPNLVPVGLSLNAGIYNVLFGLRAGAAVVVLDRFTPAAFADAVARHQIRSSVLPPAAITMLNDDPLVGDLVPLRYVRSITAPLSPLQARRFADRFGVAVLNGYGQAEIGEVIGWTAADAREHPEKVGAIGRPHPGVAIRVADPDEHGVGRLLVRPPSMAIDDGDGPGHGDALRERVDADGYVDTGDLARVDDDGFVWIEGRAGDVINRGGNKVFPEHVEEVLRLVPGVSDAAVVGGPDDRLGEVPVAFVVAETSVIDAELDATCRAHLVAYKVPVAYHRIDSLPRNEIGKLLRRDLVARLARPEGKLQ